jgi:hypothetical protein
MVYGRMRMRKTLFKLLVLFILPFMFAGCIKVTAENKNPGDMYCTVFDSFMTAIDPSINGSIKFIAIDMTAASNLAEKDKQAIIDYMKKKYKVDVTFDSLQSLEKKGLYNKEKNYIDGILLSVADVTKKSENDFEINGQKFRASNRNSNIKCNLEYVNGKWSAKSSEVQPKTAEATAKN